jgi:hypothetical protein
MHKLLYRLYRYAIFTNFLQAEKLERERKWEHFLNHQLIRIDLKGRDERRPSEDEDSGPTPYKIPDSDPDEDSLADLSENERNEVLEIRREMEEVKKNPKPRHTVEK